MSVTENARRVLEQAAEAALRSGRRPEDVLVVAATKFCGPQAVREAIAAGIRACGENREKELTEKNALGAYAGSELHFIGSLQKNKVRRLVGVCALIQSVGSREVLLEIARRASERGVTQPLLLEVNIGREETKSGLLPEEVEETAALCAGLGGVCLSGLMAIPPAGETMARTVEYFSEMRKLYVDLQAKKYDNSAIHFLSMGMSADFAAAIEAGANVVRVGTAIFGPRPAARP